MLPPFLGGTYQKQRFNLLADFWYAIYIYIWYQNILLMAEIPRPTTWDGTKPVVKKGDLPYQLVQDFCINSMYDINVFVSVNVYVYMYI